MKIQYSDDHITVFESALYRTTSTLVAIHETLLIVDPNWLPEEIKCIKDYIERHYKSHKQYLLFTHSDYDHIIGYGVFPDAEVIASDAFAQNKDKDKILNQITIFDNTYYIERTYPIVYPEVHHLISHDETTLNIGVFEMVFYLAPGHCTDAMFIIIPTIGCWIAGDYLSNIEIPLIDHDFLSYQTTLNKAAQIFEKYPVHKLITGHGDIALNRQEIQTRINNDIQYLNLSYKCQNEEINDEIRNHILKYSRNPFMLQSHQQNVLNLSDHKKTI